MWHDFYYSIIFDINIWSTSDAGGWFIYSNVGGTHQHNNNNNAQGLEKRLFILRRNKTKGWDRPNVSEKTSLMSFNEWLGILIEMRPQRTLCHRTFESFRCCSSIPVNYLHIWRSTKQIAVWFECPVEREIESVVVVSWTTCW